MNKGSGVSEREWSQELQKFTIFSLTSGNFLSNPKLDGVCFKHMDGRFGYIKTDDAVIEKYHMHIIGEDTIIEYSDAISVVTNGWAID